MRALVINTAFLGDVIFTLPLLDNLRLFGAEVDLLARPRFGALVERTGLCAIAYDKRGADRGLGALARLGAELRGRRYDLVLGAHPSLRSGLLAAWAGAPRSFGWGRWGYRVRVPRGARFVEDARALGLAAGVPDRVRRPRLEVPAVGRAGIGLVPGARWGTKRWPAAHWASLARSLAATHPILWLGGEGEARLAPPIGRQLFGAPLRATAAALAGCQLVVGGDSGLLHLARAVGTPVVMLFGPTASVRLPPDPGRLDLQVSDLPCRPCSAHGPTRCPLRHHRCMADLAPEVVLHGIHALLGA